MKNILTNIKEDSLKTLLELRMNITQDSPHYKETLELCTNTRLKAEESVSDLNIALTMKIMKIKEV